MQNPIEHIMDNKSEKQFTLNNATIVSDVTKYGVVLFYAVFILISAFYFNNIAEIIGGICRIIVAPSILVSDYIVIGNIGATLVNSGLVMITSIVIAKISNTEMNGPVVAAIFTIGAFAFFGKNIYNIWSIFLGVYFYALLRKEKFSKYIIVAFFGTALGPLVSQISFGLDFPMRYGVILGNVAGIMAGFIMPPLAKHFSKFHQGFNLYNMGFTAGIVGSLFMSILRGYGKNNEALAIVSKGNNLVFTIYLSIIFATMIMLGYILNNRSFTGYVRLLKRSGKASSDFIELEGFGLTMINMGLVGFLAVAYVILVRGELNGPTIGGILTIVAFAAFGKHVRNILPIFLGVFIASATQVWDINATGPLLAALFGTTLAPIAGQYGWKIGTLAGFMHMTLVMNTGYLHGGMNLYNNGFAGGIVAASLVPIVNGIMKRDE